MPHSIATKIVVAFVSTVVIVSATLGAFRIFESYQETKASNLKSQKNQIGQIGLGIKSRIEELRHDTKFLAATPPIQGILRATKHDGIDPIDGSSITLWRQRLETIFTEMIYAKSNYLQIRYIGLEDNGRELVRVEREGPKVIAIPRSRLQQKGHRDYFKDTIKLRSSEVYLSDFGLNQEFGRVTIPAQMVLRSAVLIQDDDGNPFGIVIINMSYNHIFSTMANIVKDSEYFVADHKEMILLHSNPQFNLDLLDKSIKKIDDYLVSYKKEMQQGKVEILSTDEADAKVIAKTNLHYNPSNNNQYLSIFLLTEKSKYFAEIYRNLFIESIIIVALIFFSSLIAILVASKITHSLQQLAQIVPFVDDPKAKEQLLKISRSDDEIGVLADNIHKLSHSLLNKNQTLKAQSEALDSTALVFETDQYSHITYANPLARSTSGYSQEELSQMTLKSLCHKDSQENLLSLLEQGEGGNIQNSKELCLASKKGELFWVQSTIYPVSGLENEKKFVFIQFDISSRIRAKESLRLSKEKAEKIAKFKSEFLANMSHEIRTPISGIIGLNEFLCESPLNETQKKWAFSIRQSAASLLTIINDILDLSKFESGMIELESSEVNVRELVDAVFDILNNKAEAKGIKFHYELAKDLPHRVYTDPGRLSQILTNLLSNAIKFTERGEVFLSVAAKSQAAHSLRLDFEVRDTGIGIAKDRAQAVFEPFTQAESTTTRRFGGTGLGLTITKRFVEAMGGAIHVKSELGKGTSFFFHVETEKLSQAPKTKTITAAASEKTAFDKTFSAQYPFKILIAEDNAINQDIINIMFSKLGYKIAMASSGEEAVSMAKKNPYDVIFMDIRMPGIMGTQACEMIKSGSDFASSAAWIIAATANVFKEDRETYYNIGFDDFLAKPYSKKTLAQILINAKNQDSALRREFQPKENKVG